MTTSSLPTLRDVAAMLDTVSTSETQYHDGIGLIVVTAAEAIILKELGEISTAETTLGRQESLHEQVCHKPETGFGTSRVRTSGQEGGRLETSGDLGCGAETGLRIFYCERCSLYPVIG